LERKGITEQHILYEGSLSRPVIRGETAMDGQRAAEEISLICLTASISPGGRERLVEILAGSVDWEYLRELTNFHGIIPLVTHNLIASGLSSQVPQSYVNQLKHYHDRTIYRNMILTSELAKVLYAFGQRGIETVCLKGMALAEVLYGDPCLRTVGDIDILVRPGDISKAASLLADLGYKQIVPKQARDHPFHDEPYCKEVGFPLFLELHWALDDDKLAAFPQQDIWCRAQPLKFQGASTLMLSPEDNLLFMANHLPKHDFHVLKFLGDVVELLKKYEESLDWDYITVSARSWQIGPAVYYVLRRAKELTGAPVPDYSLGALRPSAWRWWLLNLLEDQESLASPIRGQRLRSETAALARSLMMKGPREMLKALSWQRGINKRWTWLRTAFWIVPVFVAALARYGARSVAKRRLTT
jgi:hypothetical protein